MHVFQRIFRGHSHSKCYRNMPLPSLFLPLSDAPPTGPPAGVQPGVAKKRIALVPVAAPPKPVKMVCLQVNDPVMLDGVSLIMKAWKASAEDEDVRYQYDDQDQARVQEARRKLGEEPKAPLLITKEPLVALVQGQKEQLVSIVATVAQLMGNGVQVFDDPVGNMGFTTTFTRHYHEEGTYDFHTDTSPSDTSEETKDLTKRFGSKDWLQLTLVHYLVDPMNEAMAIKRPGQGSTLYNPQACPTIHENSQVHYCPLRNGSISIFDGSGHHAVGPNYGVERGAVVYKAVLFKPDASIRAWSRDQWWDSVNTQIKWMVAKPGSVISVCPPLITRLCDALKRPSN